MCGREILPLGKSHLAQRLIAPRVARHYLVSPCIGFYIRCNFSSSAARDASFFNLQGTFGGV